MVAIIKASTAVDCTKCTKVSYFNHGRNIPVKLIGVVPSELEKGNLFGAVHSKISNIVEAFDKNSADDKLTALTLELSC